MIASIFFLTICILSVRVDQTRVLNIFKVFSRDTDSMDTFCNLSPSCFFDSFKKMACSRGCSISIEVCEQPRELILESEYLAFSYFKIYLTELQIPRGLLI